MPGFAVRLNGRAGGGMSGAAIMNGPDGTKGAGWSELFFLDEVTALAAGHRPCHTCRKQDANAFHAASVPRMAQMDASRKEPILQRERWFSKRAEAQRISTSDLRDLPDGTMIRRRKHFFAIRDRTLLPWRFEGYGEAVPLGAMSSAANAACHAHVHCFNPARRLSASLAFIRNCRILKTAAFANGASMERYDFRTQRLFTGHMLVDGSVIEADRAQANYLLNVLRLKGRRITSCCSTAGTANGWPASNPSGRKACSLETGQADPPAAGTL